jgi:hypothetical protein
VRRREFIAGLMFAAVTGRAQAQQTGKVYRIAFAHATLPVADQNQASKGSILIPAIFEELIRLGYVEGRNILIERYSGEGRAAQYPELARGIVSRNLAAKGRLPTIYPFRQYVEAGGLMSYGIELADVGRRIADMVDRILKGAKPADIRYAGAVHLIGGCSRFASAPSARAPRAPSKSSAVRAVAMMS